MSATNTPRSGRSKKKSALSKLAAKGKKLQDSQDSDQDTRSSLQVSHSRDDLADTLHRQRLLSNSDNSAHQYPIDARVEMASLQSPGDDLIDSDEGIAMTTNSYSARTNSYHRTGGGHNSDKTLDTKLRSLNVEHGASDDDDDDDDALTLNSHRMTTDNKGEKRIRNFNANMQQSVTPRSRRDFSKRGGLSSHISDDDDEEEADMEISSNHRRSASRSPSPKKKKSPLQLSSSNDQHLGMNATLRFGQDNNIQDTYRRVLERRENDDERMNSDEAAEIGDSVPDLKFPYPRPSAMSPVPTTNNNSDVVDGAAFGTNSMMDKSWSYSGKVMGTFDNMSKASLQSTSVLPMISTREAKNRSFLVGSMTSGNTLLGSEEMERYFPDRKMRIFAGTWNMCEMKQVPSSLDDFVLPNTSEYVHDMYVIGTQESTANRQEWEVKLQETLGPQHVLLHSAAHGVLYLCVFIRRDLIWFTSVVEEANVTTRPGPVGIKTKGAIGIGFTFFGTSFLFVNTHFAPHDGRINDRIADYNKISTNLQLPKSTSTHASDNVTERYDCVFWMGDLNFRLEKERPRVDDKIAGIAAAGEIPDYEHLVRHDELCRARNEGLAFQDFQEGRIKFKPTYKFDLGTDDYDSSKKMRIPSYTDRILFRCRKKHSVTCLHYDCADEVRVSDHKPVYSMFEVNLRPGRDNIPLSAGMFNREVWLEGNKRRASRLDLKSKNEKTSSVCTVQ